METRFRRRIVGVMGSGTLPHEDLAVPLGRLLAALGVHLLTGGGRGVMEAVSKAFSEVPDRKGCVIGVIPCQENDPLCHPKDGYPNPWVEIPIYTHLPLSGVTGTDPMSRNHINILSSDVIVALPGGSGTASEVSLAGRYGRAVIAFLGRGEGMANILSDVPLAQSLNEVKLFLETHLSLGK